MQPPVMQGMNERNIQLHLYVKRYLVLILVLKSCSMVRHFVLATSKHVNLNRRTFDHLFLPPPRKRAPSLPEQASQAHPRDRRLEW